MNLDRETLWLFGGLFALLSIATTIGYSLRSTVKTESAKKVIENLIARTRAWWVMCGLFGGALVIGGLAPVLMFAFTSFLALREFITLTPTKPGDHRTLFWAFFIILPLHYWTLAAHWYGLFVILIPVYAFLFIPMRTVLAGDTERFLERTSKVQWGLMVCVYFTSYAPALLMLRIPNYSAEDAARNAKLLFFLVFVTQISDVMQYVWGKLCGRHPVAPKLSPNKTIEGLLGGGLTATALGALLWWCTPFSPWQAAGLSAIIVVMGFFGGLVMSAIKRDRGVKDYGESIPGHGGVMDRIDSLCFAAPVFFHVTRWCFHVSP
jgi:phosphatidate cytidylyltransferase